MLEEKDENIDNNESVEDLNETNSFVVIVIFLAIIISLIWGLVGKNAAEEFSLSKENNYIEIPSNFNVIADEEENLVYYKHKQTPQNHYSRTYVLPYIVFDMDKSKIRLEATYNTCGDDVVVFDRIYFEVDDEKYKLKLSFIEEIFEIKHKYFSSNGYEYIDLVVEKEHLDMFKEIADSEDTEVGFAGEVDSYYFTISQDDKVIIEETIVLYELLKQEYSQ